MIGILNLDTGNIYSVESAINKIGFKSQIINQDDKFDNFTHIILPGVGNYQNLMQNIKKKNFEPKILDFAKKNKPILGICAGMQVLSSYGLEGKNTKGLNLISGSVEILSNEELGKLPHIGWNNVKLNIKHKLFEGIPDQADFYFVHSYNFILDKISNCLAKTHYIKDFNSAIYSKNIFGVQFHPEKSQKNGLKLLKNFCEINL